MTSAASTPVSPAPHDRSALVRAHPRIASAARWFWWIAGLSLVNSVVSHTGGSFNFVVGLAATQIIDAVFKSLPALAIFFDAGALVFFLGAGALARRGWQSAFVVAGLLYALDGAVFAWFGDWLPAGFHAYVLYQLFRGWRDLRDLVRHAAVANQTPLVPGAPVSLAEPGATSGAAGAGPA
jgi:hypothetical protein